MQKPPMTWIIDVVHVAHIAYSDSQGLTVFKVFKSCVNMCFK